MTYTPQVSMLLNRIKSDVVLLEDALKPVVVTTGIDLGCVVTDGMEALAYPYPVQALATYVRTRIPGTTRNVVAGVMKQRGYYRHRLPAGMFWVMAG